MVHTGHTFDISTQEAEEGQSHSIVPGHPGLHSETLLKQQQQ